MCDLIFHIFHYFQTKWIVSLYFADRRPKKNSKNPFLWSLTLLSIHQQQKINKLTKVRFASLDLHVDTVFFSGWNKIFINYIELLVNSTAVVVTSRMQLSIVSRMIHESTEAISASFRQFKLDVYFYSPFKASEFDRWI